MILRRAVALVAALAFGACAAGAQPAVHPARRIVSLIPSLTEDLFAIGAGAQVVGVSQFTDYPPAARRLPVISTVSSVDSERVVRLHPDVAVGIPSQTALMAELAKAGIRGAVYADDTYDDIFRDLAALGTLSGHESAAAGLIASLRSETAALRRSVGSRPRRPSVFVVLGVAPIFTVGRGSYIEKLIDMAGGINAASASRSPYPRFSAEALVALQPDALVVDPTVDLPAVAARAPWSSLRAVRERRVFTLPEAGILERPGPRYVQGLRWLIERLATVKG
ncbi:MAG: ABC transporter substrate-binding protein [Candidatus Velthaea sp.]